MGPVSGSYKLDWEKVLIKLQLEHIIQIRQGGLRPVDAAFHTATVTVSPCLRLRVSVSLNHCSRSVKQMRELSAHCVLGRFYSHADCLERQTDTLVNNTTLPSQSG